jgi:hypothetical protein
MANLLGRSETAFPTSLQISDRTAVKELLDQRPGPILGIFLNHLILFSCHINLFISILFYECQNQSVNACNDQKRA